MVKLIARSPLEGLLPVDAGALVLEEVTYPTIQSVSVYKGKSQSIRRLTKQEVGAELPLPNRTIDPILWIGPEQYLVLGQWIDGLEKHAAVTDQTDAWAILSVKGEGIEDILARLIPIDLRFSVFSVGQTARTLVGHMPASVTRRSADCIHLMVMRSMADTLVHEVCKVGLVFASRT